MPKPQKKAVTPDVKRAAAKAAKGAKTAKPETDKKVVAAKQAGRTGSKQSMLIALLQRPTGATVEEMAKTTGWQNHSVLGAISGVLKKQLGLTVSSGKEQRGRVYRIAGGR
jgi:hypothetical protein